MTEDQEGFGVYLLYAVNGGVVAKSELALKIAELLVEYNLGPETLAEQRPLTIDDAGDHWVILGNVTPKVIVRISKRDGRIMDFHQNVPLPIPPDFNF